MGEAVNNEATIDLLCRKLDEWKERHIRLETVVLGVNGNNGIKGTLTSHIDQFSAYRREMREEMQDMTREFTAALAGLNREVAESKKQRRAELGVFLGGVVATIGTIIVAMIQKV